MYRRYFQLCPSSFPWNYTKIPQERGFMYTSMYTSPYGSTSMLTGENEWCDYLGDIVMEIATNLEKQEQEERRNSRGSFREKFRGPRLERKEKLLVPKRLNLLFTLDSYNG